MISFNIILSAIILMIVIVILASGVYVVNQWEKAAVLRFGIIVRVSGPGLKIKLPIIETVRKIDLRMHTVDLRGQSAITRDNISVGVDAVVFAAVEDVEKLLTKVVDYEEAVSKYAQTAIRNTIGRYSLDDLLQKREEIARSLKDTIDELATTWGVDIPKTEIQDISLPADMKRAFAIQAEAERGAKAVQITAEAELLASVKYKQAAENLTDPKALQLRMLQTLSDVSKEQANTIIMALPTDILLSAGPGGLGALASINSSAGRERNKQKLESLRKDDRNP
jgi:regulator of protease activity HflC (stomatin/prohibitin superfamily)